MNQAAPRLDVAARWARQQAQADARPSWQPMPRHLRGMEPREAAEASEAMAGPVQPGAEARLTLRGVGSQKPVPAGLGADKREREAEASPDTPSWLPDWLREALGSEPEALDADARMCRKQGRLNEAGQKCLDIVREAPDGPLAAYAKKYVTRLGNAIGRTANEEAEEALPRMRAAVHASVDGDTRPLRAIEGEMRDLAPESTEKCLGLLGMSRLMQTHEMKAFHDFREQSVILRDGVVVARRSEEMRTAELDRDAHALAHGNDDVRPAPLRPTLAEAVGIRSNARTIEREAEVVQTAAARRMPA